MRLLTWILLLVHLNMTLLSPCVQEVDSYDRDGKVIDDINTVVEYVHQVALGHKDSTPEDEDKGKVSYSTTLKMPVYCLVSFESSQARQIVVSVTASKRSYPSLPDPSLLRRSLEILSPPPDASLV